MKLCLLIITVYETSFRTSSNQAVGLLIATDSCIANLVGFISFLGQRELGIGPNANWTIRDTVVMPPLLVK
jgi:hypothetical protein